VSPDGARLAFVSNASGTDAIWIVNRDGTNAHPLVSWPGVTQKYPDWSPDGQRVALASTRNTTNLNIWTVKTDGTDPVQLTAGASDNQQPRYSPDGTKLLFISNRTGKRELWTMGIEGNNQKAVGLQSLRISDPTWSPDGAKIAYVGCTPPVMTNGVQTTPASCNLFWITPDAGQSARITSGTVQDWNPDWGSDGIVFASDRGGTQGLWVVNPDGTNLHLLTDPGPTGDLHPKWDRHSNAVVFTRAAVDGDPASANIWAADLGGHTQQLTTAATIDSTPPVIVPTINGQIGNNGWYKSVVTVNWAVSDPESGVVSSDGCSSTKLTADTPGVTLTCQATNKAGLSSSASVTVKIDATPPVISGMPGSACVIWPVNQRLVQVATVTSADALSGLLPGSFKITGVSNEPIAPNDPKLPDIVITPNATGGFIVQLRADRLGSGSGRVYTLTATSSDLAGNTTTASTRCTVPHDQGQ
jgi:hypothetical protein